MRKLLALAGVSAVALSALTAPASAGEAGKKYEGAFENGGTNSFTLKKTNNGKKVMKYDWALFALDCDGGPETSSSHLNFGVKVKNHKFEAVAIPPGSTAEKAKLTLKGEFTGGNSAEGTMRIEGSKVPINSGGKDSCDSGKVRWTAEEQKALGHAHSGASPPIWQRA